VADEETTTEDTGENMESGDDTQLSPSDATIASVGETSEDDGKLLNMPALPSSSIAVRMASHSPASRRRSDEGLMVVEWQPPERVLCDAYLLNCSYQRSHAAMEELQPPLSKVVKDTSAVVEFRPASTVNISVNCFLENATSQAWSAWRLIDTRSTGKLAPRF